MADCHGYVCPGYYLTNFVEKQQLALKKINKYKGMTKNNHISFGIWKWFTWLQEKKNMQSLNA